jgi:hypothetical protein
MEGRIRELLLSLANPTLERLNDASSHHSEKSMLTYPGGDDPGKSLKGFISVSRFSSNDCSGKGYLTKTKIKC